MSEIKTPVTVGVVDDGAYELYHLYDADGYEISLDQIAAALNAAPKRAFEELTAEALETIFDEADEDVKRRLDKSSGAREWRVAIYAALLSRLQAFAAPVAPAWQPITVEAVKGKGYLLLRPIADLKAQAPVVAKFGYSAIEGDPEWQQDGGISYAFHCFDGWMPLPAAPEAQGGVP